jgi:hypothetical protein
VIVILRVAVFIFGLTLVVLTLYSVVETLVLPRSAPDQLTRAVFLAIRWTFGVRLKRARTYRERDRIMAFFAPMGLLALVPVWLALVLMGFTSMYWAIGSINAYEAFRMSGSSLLTLGFYTGVGWAFTILELSEAAIGLFLVALLIAYLPSMYSSFERREAAVTLLEVRAGSPPSAVEMLLRFNRIHGLDRLNEIWRAWELWFADIEESHTSHPALCFFRSPQPEHSWVTAAGAVLDAASLTLSSVDIAYDPMAALCIRAGYLTLRRIAEYFSISLPADPHYPINTISLSREEFENALDQLSVNGVPIKADRDQAWVDFAGWRVNYDASLLALASMTMAPMAPWSSDRVAAMILPPLLVRSR